MQTVSNDWKKIHRRSLLNESFVEVSLNIADPDAIADATPQDNGAIYISTTPQLTSGAEITPMPYCTLEQNIWCLDGNRKALPDSDYGINGYSSDVLSDDTCVFSDKLPIIKVTFRTTHSQLIPGVTIVWSSAYNEFPDTFEVIAYRNAYVVGSKEVTGNRSVKSLIEVDIANYNRIEIIVKKWCLPNHRARVEQVLIGLNKVYGRSELFDYSHLQSVDPASTSLPKFEIKFSVDNVEGKYNPYNSKGLAKYLMERQEVKAKYGLKMDDGSIEWINAGTFYLSEWHAPQNGITADFTARDLLEFMSDIYNEWHDYTERTLKELAELVLTAANLPLTSSGEVRWVIDDSLSSITTTAPLPQDTLANCLQLIANAGRCVIYQDRSGILHIEPLKGNEASILNVTDYNIDSFNSYSNSEITLSKPLKQVKVAVYSYTIDEITSTEISYPANVSSSTQGETIVIDNPLVTSTTVASALGQWLYTHLGHRKTIDSKWRADVRLDPLDIVRNENEYNSSRVRMTDVEFKYNGAFKATGKGKVIGNG